MSSLDNTALAIRENSFELTEWDSDLKGRRRLFVQYYCTDGDCFMKPIPAYQKAYTKTSNGIPVEPSYETAKNRSSNLMQKPEVRAAIKKLLRKAQDEIDEETRYQILRMYKELAFYNTSDIIDAKGNLKVSDISQLGELAKCVTGITRKVNDKGRESIEVKLADRFKALEAIAKYLDLIKPDGSTTINAPIMILSQKELEDEMENVTPVPVESDGQIYTENEADENAHKDW
jgi:ribosomal protein S20